MICRAAFLFFFHLRFERRYSKKPRCEAQGQRFGDNTAHGSGKGLLGCTRKTEDHDNPALVNTGRRNPQFSIVRQLFCSCPARTRIGSGGRARLRLRHCASL